VKVTGMIHAGPNICFRHSARILARKFFTTYSRNYFELLKSRGFVYQHSHDLPSADIHGVYFGVDPTASSLHVGHLLGIIAVFHAIRQG
jgi:hypothetical protein